MNNFDIENSPLKSVYADYSCLISEVQLIFEQNIAELKEQLSKNRNSLGKISAAMNELWYSFCVSTHVYCALAVEINKKQNLSNENRQKMMEPLFCLKECARNGIAAFDEVNTIDHSAGKYDLAIKFIKWFYFDDTSVDINNLMLLALDATNKAMDSISKYKGSDPRYLVKLMTEFEWGRTLVKNCLLVAAINNRKMDAVKILISARHTVNAFAFKYRFDKNASNVYAAIDEEINRIVLRSYDVINIIDSGKMPDLSLDGF